MLIFKYLVYLPAFLAQRNDNTKQKEYAMIQKSTYMAPNAELYGISIQTSILTLSGGDGAQAPNVEKMSGEDIFTGAGW